MDKYNSCNNCKYFKRFYVIKNRKFKAIIYGFCSQKKKVFADKYYCGNYTQGGMNYVDSESK